MPPSAPAKSTPSRSQAASARQSARHGASKARAPADKQARARALVDAAEAALREASYHDITILEVSRRAGLAKGTVYLYYPSKEALFLAVLTRKLETFFDTLEKGLAAASGAKGGPEQVARALTHSLLAENALLSLLSLLHTQLKPGAGVDAVIEFKSYLNARLVDVGASIDAAGQLPPGHGGRLLLRGCALAIGLQQMASPPPELASELKQRAPELAGEPMSVEGELIDSLADMIHAAKQAGS